MGNVDSCCTNKNTDKEATISEMVLATPESSDDEGFEFEERAEEHKKNQESQITSQFLQQNSLLPDSDYRKRGKDKKGKTHIPIPEETVFEGLENATEENVVLLKDLPLKYTDMINNIHAIYGPFMVSMEEGRRDKLEVFESAPVEFVSEKCYYKGQWRNKKPHGVGILITHDEDVYEGYFQNGLPCGQGRLLYKNGDFLVGEFAEGKVHGKAKLDTVTGAKIDADFEENKLSGKVKEIYRDGTRFEGKFSFVY